MSEWAEDNRQMVGELVREELARRGWTLREAEVQTEVGRGTIDNMAKGLRVSVDNLIKWASRTAPTPEQERENVVRYLRSAGLHDYVRFMEPVPPGAEDLIREVADDLPRAQAQVLLTGMSGVVDVGANLERLTPIDDDNAEPLDLGGLVRVMRIRHDCLRPLLNPGDVVFLTSPDTLQDGDIVVAAVDVFYRTCKVIRCPDGLPAYLEPLDGEGRIEEERFTVLGVVKYRLERLKNSV